MFSCPSTRRDELIVGYGPNEFFELARTDPLIPNMISFESLYKNENP
jgi:hypothetical protein